jgi:uncharacterized protein
MSESALIDCLVICDTSTGVRQCMLQLAAGATVADAIAAARRQLPDATVDWDRVEVGVWGERCGRGIALRPGDRVELYRPLVCDPKQARRARARSSQARR